MHRPLLFSLHPRWAELVFSGAKTLEIRRRFAAPTIAPTLAYVHQTGPGGGLVGSMIVQSLTQESLDDLRGPLAAQTCIPNDLLDGYLAGRTHGVALALRRPTRFVEPLPLRDLQAMGLTPPQLFTWLDLHAQTVLHRRPVQGSQGRTWRFVDVNVRALTAQDPLFVQPRALYPGFDAWFGKVQAQRRPTYGLESDGRLRAVAICAPKDPGVVKLCTFVCLERGMGSVLLPRVLATAQAYGAREVFAEVLRGQDATLGFFQRAGFAVSPDPTQSHSWRVATTLS